MKEKSSDYSYFSLNALSYLTTLLFGIALGLSIAIWILHVSQYLYEVTPILIYLIVPLVILGLVLRSITLYVWSKRKKPKS